jgi:type I restriction enzyme S subunit
VRQDPKEEPVAGLAQNVVAKRRTSRGQSADSSVEPLFSVPSNWRWLRMDAVTDLASGVTKGRSLVGRKTTDLPYLRVANVQAGFLDLKVIKTIDVPNDEIDEGLLLRCGDVLLTEGGDWDKLGRSAVWNGEVSPCTHQNHVFRARPVGGMNSRWISMFTNSPDGRTYFQSCAKRTTNLASINMTQLRACPVPVPPVAEQDRIVARVDELTGLLDRIEQRLAATNAAQAAFAGAAIHHVVA